MRDLGAGKVNVHRDGKGDKRRRAGLRISIAMGRIEAIWRIVMMRTLKV
jgi:hypothetical protein